ncbi:MAG: PKD domain-containing protein, partial [Candidatus Kariarchaeaceae archaeon]
MVTQTTQRGTAGAFFIIAMLLGTMVYLNLDTHVNPLGDIDDNAISVERNTVYVGEEVIFSITPAVLYNYGIQFFMWDFHDNSYIEVSTPDEPYVTHTFLKTGEFMVSVLALHQNFSRIFAIPISVISEPQQISIDASSDTVFEDEVITFSASTTAQYTPILNYLWEWGDGEVSFGQNVNHTYVEQGE